MTAAAAGPIQIEVDGQGEPVVFVHGLGGTSNTFSAMLESFAGFRCIRPDLPGSGRSPRPFEALSIEAMAAAIVDVLKIVAGAPAHIVAHSMGTLVAQHVAVEAPEIVRSLTLFGPIVEPAEAARRRLRERAQIARGQGMVAVADAVAAAGLSSSTRGSSPVTLAFVRESHMRQDPEGFAQSCEALADAKGADLRLIRCPVLIATGDEDAIAPPGVAQGLADRLKGARLKIFDRCGHWTPLERPKDCGKLAADFARAQAD
jgi:pimeloyl-ACP methyl ester carboxylesterase